MRGAARRQNLLSIALGKHDPQPHWRAGRVDGMRPDGAFQALLFVHTRMAAMTRLIVAVAVAIYICKKPA
jgi:hypothetical protein